jgi:hypothetical protein
VRIFNRATTDLTAGDSLPQDAHGSICCWQLLDEGGAVRLFTRHGYAWTDRSPAIAASPRDQNANFSDLEVDQFVVLEARRLTRRASSRTTWAAPRLWAGVGSVPLRCG